MPNEIIGLDAYKKPVVVGDKVIYLTNDLFASQVRGQDLHVKDIWVNDGFYYTLQASSGLTCSPISSSEIIKDK